MTKTPAIPQYRLSVANAFGVFGYLSCLVQWLWLAVIFLPAVMSNSSVSNFITPQESANQAPVITFEPSPVVVALVVLIAAAVIAACTVALLRLPSQIGQAGKKLTQAPAPAVLPTLTHHKKISKKKKLELTYRITQGVKLLLIFVPFVALLGSYFVSSELPYVLATLIGAFCAVTSLVWFGIQAVLGRLWRIPADQLV